LPFFPGFFIITSLSLGLASSNFYSSKIEFLFGGSGFFSITTGALLYGVVKMDFEPGRVGKASSTVLLFC